MHTNVAHQEPWSKRPQFAPRQLLDAERLNAALEDELERERILNLALHGWGVVHGFGVSVERGGGAGRLAVTCGLALDPYGRMLRTDDRCLALRDLEGPTPSEPGRYTLLVHHAERLDPPIHDPGCHGTGPQWREYGVVFTLRPGCEPVDDCCPESTDGCLSRTEYVRRRIGAADGPPGPAADLEHACDHPGSLVPTRCGSWCYDPRAGVPIGCIELCDRNGDGSDEEPTKEHAGRYQPTAHPKRGCDEPCLVIVGLCDDCSPVQLVYRNPVLRELLSCCDVDLPRVDHVSWAAWMDLGEPVRSDEFSARIQVVDEDEADDGFAIWFTRPIVAATLTPASVLLTVLTQERLADYWMAGRVPIEVRPLAVTGDLALGVQLVAEADWLGAEVRDTRSSLMDGARVEITVRGQLLRDDCGHLLDAVPTDIGCAPCQGRPGDDLIWAFDVAERDPYDRPRGGRDAYDSTRQGETT